MPRERRQRTLRRGAMLVAYPNLLAALLYVLIVTVAAWPILQRLNSVVVGDDIDVYINLWADWWTLKAWRDPALSLWQSDFLFYPVGADLTYHSFSHLNTAISLLLRPVMGAVGAYNVTILANYVLIALSMFQLARYWTGSWAAGMVAGIVFAFNSHALYQSCHPVLLSIWVLPWVTLYLSRALKAAADGGQQTADEPGTAMAARANARQGWKRDAVAAGVFVFLAALVSVLMLIIVALWVALLLGGLALAQGRQMAPWLRAHWRALALFGLTGALLALPVVWLVMWEGLVGGDGSYLTNPDHSLVTDLASLWTPHWVEWYVRGIYVGMMPAALALLALWRGRRAAPWLALFFGALLMAVGPVPMLDGRAQDVYLPWSAWLALLLRNTYRLNILVSLGLAMLAALGWVVLRDTLPRRRLLQGAVAALVAGFILVEYLLPGVPYTRLSVPRFYGQTVAAMPADTVVAIVPTGRQVDKLHLFYQTLHEKRMTNGVISRAEGSTERFLRSNALLRAGHYELPPSPLPHDPVRALRELAAEGVDLLVIEKGWSGIDVPAWRTALGEEAWYEDGRVLVYDVGRTIERLESGG